MHNDREHMSPEEIEREIEMERSQLTGTLASLQDRLSIEGMTDQISDMFRSNGGDVTRTIGRVARENPVGVALTGIGLAWLVFGGKSSGRDATMEHPAAHHEMPDPDHDSHRSAAAAARTFEDNDVGTSRWDRMKNRARELKDDVSDKFGSANDAGRDKARRAAYKAEGLKARTYASSVDLRNRIYEGTEGLSESAKKRVVAARVKAAAAQREAERKLRQGSDSATAFFREQPLMAGALAVAAGAALGALMPRTRREDEAFGVYRDSLFDEAERVYAEERERIGAAVDAATEEAKKIASETAESARGSVPTGREAVEKTEAGVSSAANRIATAAKDAHDSHDTSGDRH